jgi:DNA-directed RNA polymerase specialized sigma subunit
MTQNPKSLARKLLVFRACKNYMERHGRAPTVSEVAEILDIPPPTAWDYMHALNGADGLPYEMLTNPRGGDGASVFGADRKPTESTVSPDQATDHYMADYFGQNLIDGFRILRA